MLCQKSHIHNNECFYKYSALFKALNEYVKFSTQHTNIEQVALYAEVGV